jgi:hypothetical protein
MAFYDLTVEEYASFTITCILIANLPKTQQLRSKHPKLSSIRRPRTWDFRFRRMRLTRYPIMKMIPTHLHRNVPTYIYKVRNPEAPSA